MDKKVFARLEKKIDEFIQETADEDIKFFFGDHLPEIMATAAAAVFDGMEYTTHLANDVGSFDNDGILETAEEFIMDARKAQSIQRAKADPA